MNPKTACHCNKKKKKTTRKAKTDSTNIEHRLPHMSNEQWTNETRQDNSWWHILLLSQITEVWVFGIVTFNWFVNFAFLAASVLLPLFRCYHFAFGDISECIWPHKLDVIPFKCFYHLFFFSFTFPFLFSPTNIHAIITLLFVMNDRNGILDKNRCHSSEMKWVLKFLSDSLKMFHSTNDWNLNFLFFSLPIISVLYFISKIIHIWPMIAILPKLVIFFE